MTKTTFALPNREKHLDWLKYVFASQEGQTCVIQELQPSKVIIAIKI